MVVQRSTCGVGATLGLNSRRPGGRTNYIDVRLRDMLYSFRAVDALPDAGPSASQSAKALNSVTVSTRRMISSAIATRRIATANG
jgi:hypothetical protein